MQWYALVCHFIYRTSDCFIPIHSWLIYILQNKSLLNTDALMAVIYNLSSQWLDTPSAALTDSDTASHWYTFGCNLQDSCTNLVFKAKKKKEKKDLVQPLLQALHWLPIQARVDYKLSTICHSFSESSPAYFFDFSTVHTPSRQLCSSADTHILHIPYVRTKPFGQHCSSYCAHQQWNLLLSDIRHI